MLTEAVASFPDAIIFVNVIFSLLHQFQSMGESFFESESPFGIAENDFN